MKVVICGLSLILFHLILVVENAPVHDESVETIENQYNLNPDGSFQYNILQSDRTAKRVNGILKNVNGADVLVLEGSYSYTTPEMFDVFVEFVADERGLAVVKIKINNIGSKPHIEIPPIPQDENTPLIEPTFSPIPISINPKAIGSILG